MQPFDVVALHGMVRDEYGKKMSKSFGNVVDPLDWIDRYGADATRFTLARGANPGCGRAGQRGVVPGLAQLLQQALERDPVRADERRHGRRATLPDTASCPLSTGGSCPGCSTSSPRSTSTSRRSSSPRSATRCTTSPGTTSATGTSSWPSRCSPRGGRAARTRPAGCSATCSTSCCGCCTRSIPFVTEELWTALTGERVGGPGRPGRPWTAPVSTTRPRPSWPRCSRWSPRSAGSAPTRACARVSGWRPGSTGSAGAGSATHEPLIRSLARLDEPSRRLRGDGDAVGRRRGQRRARHPRRDRRGGRTGPARQGPGRRREGDGAVPGQARQRGVRRQGARAGGREDPRTAGRRPRPTWLGSPARSPRSLSGASARG